MKRTGILLLCMLAITGCLFWAREQLYGTKETGEPMLLSGEIQEPEAAKGTARETEVIKEAEAVKEMETATFTQEDLSAIKDREPFESEYYAYQQLSGEQKELYDNMYGALILRKEEVPLLTSDTDEIAFLFQCILNDHPEIFYVDGYAYTEYTLGNNLRKLTFSGTYCMDEKQVAMNQALIDRYVEQCFAGMPLNLDEYGIVKYVYEYLIQHTEYDEQSPNNQNICSVFVDNRSVCQGYAKATQYLLQKAGVFATLVLGNVHNGEGHAWNLVQIDGEYYFVDTTWGDASYQVVESTSSITSKQLPTINYDYLCVNTQQIQTTHYIDNVVPLPTCNSMRANYYVREGEYFTEVNETQLKEIFQKRYDRDEKYVTLKCASYEVYQQMRDYLIDKQMLFQYLNSADGKVSYTENESQYSMSFWL